MTGKVQPAFLPSVHRGVASSAGGALCRLALPPAPCPTSLAAALLATCREGGQRLLSTQGEHMAIEASASPPPRLPSASEHRPLLKGQTPSSSSQPASSPPMPQPFFPPLPRPKHRRGGSGSGSSPEGGSPKAAAAAAGGKHRKGSKQDLGEEEEDICPTCLDPYTGGCWQLGATQQRLLRPPAGAGTAAAEKVAARQLVAGSAPAQFFRAAGRTAPYPVHACWWQPWNPCDLSTAICPHACLSLYSSMHALTAPATLRRARPRPCRLQRTTQRCSPAAATPSTCPACTNGWSARRRAR